MRQMIILDKALCLLQKNIVWNKYAMYVNNIAIKQKDVLHLNML